MIRYPLTPPEPASRNSIMSWEEVGGAADQEVPMDKQYHKKSGSISAKIGRNIRSAMRKRSQRRSSTSTSPPTSPGAIIQSFSRRESASSQASVKGHMRHTPSISSLAPSSMIPESSANSILLQHQLASEPSPVSYMARADIHDPRIHSSKLSPFPGIAHLEAPGMAQQASDSIVPTRQTSTDIYALPLPHDGSRRVSDDSAGKRGWLAKAFISPRSSGSVSRKPSSGEIAVEDPFAAPPLPTSRSRHRSASPSVSIVQEVSEEGSRLTRFTQKTDMIPVEEEPLPSKSMNVLNRMDDLLALEPDDPARPDILDDPPRKLLLATQILQVVNMHVSGKSWTR